MIRLGWLLILAGCETAAAPPGGNIAWFEDHDAALAYAQQEHKPMLIDFTAAWCVPCKELELKTYPDARVRAEAQRFVSVRIDATEMTPAIDKLFARYGVQSLPTIVFLDAAGAVLAEPRLERFAPPEAFVQLLQQVR